MQEAMRIFFVNDTKDLDDRMLYADLRKRTKGFIRLGHDTQVFSYNTAFRLLSPFKSQSLSARFYKRRVDDLLVRQIGKYCPDVVHVAFAKHLDVETVIRMREAASGAFFLGLDVDLWPELHQNRIEAAKELDILLTTYDGRGIHAYRQAGVHCVFMPNMCDPDIEHRYDVAEKWKSDILFTGRLRHKNYPTEEWRAELVHKISERANGAVYGSCGRPFLGGIEYFYAISGAKIGLSINAANDIRLYHSDRFTHYLACGTLVLAKRVPDSDRLCEEGKHLRYFDTVEEFFDLADWYLHHEDERARIADAGMRRAHTEFNCERMAKYILDVVETGAYSAPWT